MNARLWALLGLLLVPACLLAAGSEQTINTLPAANSGFQTNLSNFLKREDAQRYQRQFEGFVLSGGTHSTIASLTATPAAIVAFPGGYYITEIGSITYLNNETTWVIAHKDLTGNFSNFSRVPGTHYLIDSVSASKPALPADSVWLMEVTTAGGSVTAVLDLRTRVPYAGTYLLTELPAAGQRGRLAFVRDVGSSGTLYLDSGTAWLQTMSNNPMTAAADLIVGGTAGAPTRLAKGTANQVLGMNNADTAQEYKTLTAGNNISITHGAGAVTIAQTGLVPSGTVSMFIGAFSPTGWLICDGSSYDADTYPELFDLMVSRISVWGRGTALGTFTVNTGTDVVTLTAHGLTNDSRVHLASSGTLPSGMGPSIRYFIINATTDTFQLASTVGGASINITTTGSGTHSLYDKFQVPDFRARSPVGSNVGSHDFTISAVDTGTEQLTIESNAALYTGDSTFYDTTAGTIGGLTDATTYYVIRVSATVVKLATTEANALAGTAINLTSAGSGTQVLRQNLTTRALGAFGGTENIAGGSHGHTLTDPGHTHGLTTGNSIAAGTRVMEGSNAVSALNTQSATTGMTVTNDSTQGAGSNMAPFLVVDFMIKT